MPAHMRVLTKPPKGAAKADRRKRRRAIETAEARAKRAAKERDGWRCRRCGWPDFADDRGPLEAAHIITKGHGGDGGRYSRLPKHFVSLCRMCHQGPRSVHSGHVAMAWHPEKMGDGVVRFVDADPGKGWL